MLSKAKIFKIEELFSVSNQSKYFFNLVLQFDRERYSHLQKLFKHSNHVEPELVKIIVIYLSFSMHVKHFEVYLVFLLSTPMIYLVIVYQILV